MTNLDRKLRPRTSLESFHTTATDATATTSSSLQRPTPAPSTLSLADAESLAHLEPIPSYEESLSAPRPGPLQILGATWGGVTVTQDLQRLAAGLDELTLDMKTLWTILTPDPAPGKLKVLTVLYRFDDDKGKGKDGHGQGEEEEPENDLNEMRLLSVPEDVNPSKVVISRRAAMRFLGEDCEDGCSAQSGGSGAGGRRRDPRVLHGRVGRAWRAGPQGEVDILAVVYGPKKIETPSALTVLSNHFEGRWGQVRMTNAFFGTDPWPYKRKSWTVYFRFVGSKRVQVVTGWEDGALEVPWSRYP
ncbi:hypothetical protein VTJ83DRAFT_3076 [Remersonia thermophila]|uniref:Uncharacterized protein n=1 Tax=Remersonia thermophila TaxID=72144 RepID=A0ABR4DDP2_9PEZI